MAIGPATATDVGTAASDLIGGISAYEGDQLKAKGLQVEGENYTLAAQLAGQNEQFAATSTAIQQFQAHRQLEISEGRTQAAVGAAGGTAATGEDVMRESAAQGAMQKMVIGQQGLMTEAGYAEQEAAYTNLANYSSSAANKEKEMGALALGGGIAGAALSGIAAVATVA
jgi:hypothetical protein